MTPPPEIHTHMWVHTVCPTESGRGATPLGVAEKPELPFGQVHTLSAHSRHTVHTLVARGARAPEGLNSHRSTAAATRPRQHETEVARAESGRKPSKQAGGLATPTAGNRSKRERRTTS